MRAQLYKRVRRGIVQGGTVLARAGDRVNRVLLVGAGSVVMEEGGFPTICQTGTAIGLGEMLLGDSERSTPLAATYTASPDAEVELYSLDALSLGQYVTGPTRLRRERALPVVGEVVVFSGLSPADKAIVASVLHERVYRAGDVIVKQESPPDHLYFIVSGFVNIVRSSPQGEIEFSVELRDGAYFGEVSFLKDERRAASVVAGSDTVTCLCLKGELFRLLPPSVIGLLRINVPNLRG
jgi:hypothetical protein